jgi:hypothetical protein
MSRLAAVRTFAPAMTLAVFGSVSLGGCPSSGVGAACTPEDEYKEAFAGFTLDAAFVDIDRETLAAIHCARALTVLDHHRGLIEQ